MKVTTANADEFVFEEFGPVFNRFTIAKADDTDGLSLTGTSFQNNSDTFEITNEQVVDM